MRYETVSPASQSTEELPACSILRDLLVQTSSGPKSSSPYMQAMRREGVKRILFEVETVWREHRAQNLRITRKLYFREYDRSESEITDLESIRQIESAEVGRIIEQEALDQAASAIPFHGIDPARPRFSEGELGYCRVELFDDARFKVAPPRILPLLIDPNSNLLRAATSGDLVALAQILKSKASSPADLNEALIAAAASNYDNGAAIKMLLSAGGDINAHGRDGETPLISAVATPCNIKVLLANGANLAEKDRWSHTALQLAQAGGRTLSAQLLEQASNAK